MIKNPKYRRIILVILLIITVTAYFYFEGSGSEAPKEISFSEFASKVQDKDSKIKSIRINLSDREILGGTGKNPDEFSSGIPSDEGKNGLEGVLNSAHKNNLKVYTSPLPSVEATTFEKTLNYLPILILILVVVFVLFSSGLIKGGFAVQAENPDVDFSDVAGCGEAIQEIGEIKEYLHDPDKFSRLGAYPPRGVLLYGPPGTGKTLLAKALAAEAEVPFYAMTGSSFVEMFAGLGAQRVRKLFKEAAKHAPAIIFIDEIDALGGRRGGGSDGASRESDQTLNQFLSNMNGFNESKIPVIVVGATNRFESLDPALVRPGRFDRHISIDAPDREGRLQILNIHCKGKPLSKTIDLDRLAIQTSGMTGADLALIINEGAIIATRRDGSEITNDDLDSAFLRVVAGAEKQNRAMSKPERKRVAIHEAGHAIVKEQLKGNEQVHKISIIPRGQSGGQTIAVTKEDIFLHSVQDLKNNIAGLLGGRAAEEIRLGNISSGAADDLKRATGIAEQMVADLGMGETLGLKVRGARSMSDETNTQLDKEIKKILDDEYQNSLNIIKQNQGMLDKIVDILLTEETIDRDEFLEVYQQFSDDQTQTQSTE